MADSYIDMYYDVDNGTLTEQEGVEIHGRDGIFCTSPIYTDIPLLTKAQSVAEAINELFSSGTGTANDDFRAVIDDSAGNIIIVVQKNDIYADYVYTYEYVDFSDDLTTQSTDPEGNVTTTTRSFTKRIITKVTDSKDNVILTADYDAESGIINSYNDIKGELIRLEEWRTAYDISEAQSEGAKSAVIAWVLAKNMEQSESVSQQKDAYRQGVADYSDKVITEEWETTDSSLDIDPDGALPALTNMTQGYTATYDSGEKVRVYIKEYYQEFYSSGAQVYLSAVESGKLTVAVTNAYGTTETELYVKLSKSYNANGNCTSTYEMVGINVEYITNSAVIKYKIKYTAYDLDGTVLVTQYYDYQHNVGINGNYVGTTNY